MNINTLWSLRLGFSAKQSSLIQDMGLERFLSASFNAKPSTTEPSFLQKVPKTIEEWKTRRQGMKSMSAEEKKMNQKVNRQTLMELKGWWVTKMQNERFPLREKMVVFWHNHFVAASQKVKASFWIYEHNQLLRENAFGNFRELTRKMVKNNAVGNYLDSNDNKKNRINENLSRELLELFTLGIGNYTETDI
ncbi:MAG: DUF1800 family protein, partial [Chitinophagales bacterium]